MLKYIWKYSLFWHKLFNPRTFILTEIYTYRENQPSHCLRKEVFECSKQNQTAYKIDITLPKYLQVKRAILLHSKISLVSVFITDNVGIISVFAKKSRLTISSVLFSLFWLVQLFGKRNTFIFTLLEIKSEYNTKMSKNSYGLSRKTALVCHTNALFCVWHHVIT